jgi:hypothetical protein
MADRFSNWADRLLKSHLETAGLQYSSMEANFHIGLEDQRTGRDGFRS